MSCAQVQQLLDAWLDGELDPATAASLARHVQGCAACSARRAAREELIASLRAPGLRFAAPPALHSAVESALPRPGRGWRRWMPTALRWHPATAMAAMAAAATVASVATAVLTLWIVQPQRGVDDAFDDALAARHAAALAGPLVAQASDDRHQIKPWFHGRIDFAPPVRDLSAEGFVLLGARLDQAGAQPAAAVVYRIRNHPVSLFVWRVSEPHSRPLALREARGFVVARWQAHGLAYAAVSDVAAADVQRFAAALATPGAQAP